MEIKARDIVKYSQPASEWEKAARFVVREVMPQFENGPLDDAPSRVLMELVCDMAIRPTETVLLSDIVRAE